MISTICSLSAEATLIENSSYDLTQLDWRDHQPKYIIDRDDVVEWLVMGEQIETLEQENATLRDDNSDLTIENKTLKGQRNNAYTIGGISVLFAVLVVIFNH